MRDITQDGLQILHVIHHKFCTLVKLMLNHALLIDKSSMLCPEGTNNIRLQEKEMPAVITGNAWRPTVNYFDNLFIEINDNHLLKTNSYDASMYQHILYQTTDESYQPSSYCTLYT